MYGGHWYGGGFMWMFMFFLIILFFWLLRGDSGNETNSEKTARDILEERYAKGEIDQEEFEQKKKTLGG